VLRVVAVYEAAEVLGRDRAREELKVARGIEHEETGLQARTFSWAGSGRGGSAPRMAREGVAAGLDRGAWQSALARRAAPCRIRRASGAGAPQQAAGAKRTSVFEDSRSSKERRELTARSSRNRAASDPSNRLASSARRSLGSLGGYRSPLSSARKSAKASFCS